MTYVIAATLGLIFVLLDIEPHITAANVVHVRHGREPNAGCSIFPGIVFMPLLWAGAAWCLDQLSPGFGLQFAIGAFVLYLPLRWRLLRGLRRELRELTSKAGGV